MTLLITLFAAVISSVVWYNGDNRLRVDLLCWMFWGASLMWFVDVCFEYAGLGAAYFTPKPYDMLNDAFLGMYVVALALVIWVVYLFVKDPKGIMKRRLFGKDKE